MSCVRICSTWFGSVAKTHRDNCGGVKIHPLRDWEVAVYSSLQVAAMVLRIALIEWSWVTRKKSPRSMPKGVSRRKSRWEILVEYKATMIRLATIAEQRLVICDLWCDVGNFACA